MTKRSREQLESGLDHVRAAPIVPITWTAATPSALSQMAGRGQRVMVSR